MSAPSGRRIEAPPSITQLAASAVRKMIFSGELRPGERVVESQVAGALGVSKPPLREALRVLEQEGLVVRSPRRGVVVTPLTLHDVYEIVTLRHDLERLAVDLGVPCRAPERIDRCREAYAALERAAEAGDAAAVTERGFAFHVAVVGLAGHRRLEDAYRSLALQLHLCMAMNRRARSTHETLTGDARRHRRILELVEAGDPAAVHHELAHHGDRSFLLEAGETFPGGSPESLAWLESVRRQDKRNTPGADAALRGQPGAACGPTSSCGGGAQGARNERPSTGGARRRHEGPASTPERSEGNRTQGSGDQ